MEGYWKIRFDIIDASDYKQFLTSISDNCDRCIFYYHPNGKTDGKSPHIHGLIYNYKQTDDTLRKHTKKFFNLTKVPQCSISNTFSRGTKMSDITYPKYIVYMSKGQYDPVFAKGFTEEESTLAKSLWKDQNEKILVIEPREKVQPKLTQYQCAKEAMIRYYQLGYTDDDPDYRIITQIVINVLHDNRILAHDNTVTHIIQSIQSEINPDRFITRVLRRCEL